jgi:bacillithiol system protein YtxJ
MASLLQESRARPILFFKHSTRCSISAAALGRLERGADRLPAGLQLVYLDLIRYRDLSNALANALGVAHESPQVLLVHHGRCVYNASHFDIRPEDVPVVGTVAD